LPESLLHRRFKLGTFLGIGLYVHWSLALVIAYVALSSRDGGVAAIAFGMAQLCGVFLCVTLHEYGHAMAARRFGIGTADITLLPIGGVARLRQMPRIPWQELVVAVAGPAVNLVIACLLLSGLFMLTDTAVLRALAGCLVSTAAPTAVDEAMLATLVEIFVSPSVIGFAVSMLIVNLVLVVFNMIPAFPMDGGRVFRSLLAMFIDYRSATSIASQVGVVCAVLIALVSLRFNPSNPIPVLIAVFVGYAGMAEARQVDVLESVRGLTAGQVMIQSTLALPMDMPLVEIARVWQSLSAPSLPVVSLAGTVVGVLQLREVAEALSARCDPSTTAGELVEHASYTGTIRAGEPLVSALARTGRSGRQIPVVDHAGRLVGMLDLDSMLSRGELPRLGGLTDRRQRFDRSS
jgi:Zn-dependent protease